MTDLTVNIRTARKSIYKGTASSVTSTNDKGEFDILSQHANFISLVRGYIILNKNTTQEKKYAISTGIVKAEKNTVDVFLDV